jgi:hypothetical protein
MRVMAPGNLSWVDHFHIQSEAELDFVIGQHAGVPIGMSRKTSPEFRRRILAAAISYQFGLRSIDYALKRYVESDLYEEIPFLLGDATSDYLHTCTVALEQELRKLHTTTEELPFGVLGAELTLYKIPYTIDIARMLANRGLLLEVLPILRQCLEMMCWANVAFHIREEDKVVTLKAQNCISRTKLAYEPVGRLYGYLSTFTHWGHVVHGHFLNFADDQVAVLKASARYRAMALALCLVLVDVLVGVVRQIYQEKGDTLATRIQGSLSRDRTRNAYQAVLRIAELTGLEDVRRIQSFLST